MADTDKVQARTLTTGGQSDGGGQKLTVALCTQACERQGFVRPDSFLSHGMLTMNRTLVASNTVESATAEAAFRTVVRSPLMDFLDATWSATAIRVNFVVGPIASTSMEKVSEALLNPTGHPWDAIPTKYSLEHCHTASL